MSKELGKIVQTKNGAVLVLNEDVKKEHEESLVGYSCAALFDAAANTVVESDGFINWMSMMKFARTTGRYFEDLVAFKIRKREVSDIIEKIFSKSEDEESETCDGCNDCDRPKKDEKKAKAEVREIKDIDGLLKAIKEILDE